MTPNPQPDTTDPVLEALTSFDCQCSLKERDSGHRLDCAMGDINIERAIAIHKAQMRIVEGTRLQDHRFCDCDVCTGLATLDALLKGG